MKENCNKYESLYTFRTEEELEEHLKSCTDCQAEQEKMDKVSELLKEVRPYYLEKRQKSTSMFKVACVLFIGMFAGVLIGYFTQFGSYTITSDNSTNTTSSTNEYGMPTDSYGLISLN